MFKTRSLIMLVIVAFLFNSHALLVFGQTSGGTSPASIKAEVVKRGVNPKKMVRVKMLDGSKRKGFISQIGDEGFTLDDSKTKISTTIAYGDVKVVKGPGLAGGARVGIIVGAAAGATLLVLYIAFLNATRDN